MERTKNTIRNMIWEALNRIIAILLPFIIRTVLIQKLGIEYLGLNSLFSSVLQILNITELGFSSAIVYSMYKPIANKDTKTVNALMNLYKKIYRIIGLIILVVGLALMPFLDKIISGDVPDNINIITLYLIYLGNTVISYWMFAYKTVLLNVHQRKDIVSKISSILSLLQSALQIIILIFLQNYYIYVLVLPIITILQNILSAVIATKKYPEYVCEGKVSKEAKKDIWNRVSGLMVVKVSTTTRNSLDSIFLSMFLGLNILAMYNNYYTIMNAVIGVMTIITGSMLAGVGNSIAVETPEKNYSDLKKFDFIYMLIAGWCTICLLCLYQPFMKIWMGEQNLLDMFVVILLCLYFYLLKMGDIKSMYLDGAGLWHKIRVKAIFEALSNIVLNYFLGKFFGIYGIVLATIITIFIYSIIYSTKILFKNYFINIKVSDYFLYQFKYFIVTAIVAALTYLICSLINTNDILTLVLRAIICVVVPTVLYFIVYRKTKEFENAKVMVKNMIKNIGLKRNSVK